MHLLKWHYQPSRRQRGHSWATSILNARSEIADILERSPGLHQFLAPTLEKAYRPARRLAQVQTRLPLETFPETCPWTLDDILDDDFWPEA
jgi:hypothetical protein